VGVVADDLRGPDARGDAAVPDLMGALADSLVRTPPPAEPDGDEIERRAELTHQALIAAGIDCKGGACIDVAVALAARTPHPAEPTTDTTDWSRYLLGACSSSDSLRQAVVHNHAQVQRLRARVAELEAGEVRTEWGIRWPEPDGAVRYVGSSELVHGPDTERFREAGGQIVQREAREYFGPWIEVFS
jgi:hypothetical protein